jgi:hypothetical protein
MLTIPITPDAMKAESEYRLERAKRDFRLASRRSRPAKGSQPEPRHALRPRPAA